MASLVNHLLTHFNDHHAIPPKQKLKLVNKKGKTQKNKTSNNNKNRSLPDLVHFLQPIQDFGVVGLDNRLTTTVGHWCHTLLWVLVTSVVDTQVHLLLSGLEYH